jgi:anti-sigma factor RsiW
MPLALAAAFITMFGLVLLNPGGIIDRSRGNAVVVQSFAEDGYNILPWAHDGFEFWAVSDVNAGDLRAFADLEMKIYPRF